MGVVYEARQRKLNRTVALKMVLAGEHASERVLARFLAEAETAAGLQHSHIIQIHELGEAMGLPYIAMEFVGGITMGEQVRSFRDDFRAIAGFFGKLARATHWAHQHAVIHRDLKPANVLIGLDGEPKIADFGLAKRLDDSADRTALTRSGEQMGTPAYMAPEQAFSELGDIGPATDTYSLGVMLYEALAGKVPIQGSSHAEMMGKLRNEDPSSPAWLRPGLPRDLETICMKCLRKKPRDRYASASELADDLHRFIADEPILAKPPSPLTKTFRWVRRHRVSMSVAVTMLLVAAVAAGAWARQQYLSALHQKQLQEEHEYLHVREYALTFSGFVKHHGQYRGAGPPLTEEEAAHRFLSFQIVRAGREGRCVRMTRAGPDGKPSWLFASTDMLVPGLLDGVARHRLPCICELRYNEAGDVQEERVSDASGHLITRFRYSYPEGYDPNVPQTAYITGDFVDELSAPLKTATGLSSVQLARDSAGREQRILYADVNGHELKDKSGAGGLEITYDPEGMITGVTVLDEKGKPAADADGRAIVKTEWSAAGRPVWEAFFDLKQKPATVHGVHISRTECDRWGNVVGTRYFGIDGVTPAQRQIPGISGPSEQHWSLDDRGRPESLTSSGYDAASAGFSKLVTKFEWDSAGGLFSREAALDPAGNPARGVLGYHTSEKVSDALGRVLRTQRDGFDPARTGYVRDVETTVWNATGDKERSELRFYDDTGKAAIEKATGVTSKRMEYGADGLLMRETLAGFNPKDVPYEKQVLDYEWESKDASGARRFPGVIDDTRSDAADISGTEPAGLALVRAGGSKPGPIQSAIKARNAKLLKKTGRYLNEKGEPATTISGNNQWERKYDDEGRDTTEIHSGFPPQEYPYARIVINTKWTQNGKSRTIVWQYEDAAGKPVRNKEKHLTYSETYDEAGHLVRIVQDGYNETRKPYVRLEITVERQKEVAGKSISWNYFDAASKPVRSEEGYRTYTEVHDSEGRGVRRIQSGYDEAVQSYATEIMETEWSGKIMRRRNWIYTDAAGNRVRYKGEYMDYTEYFDEQGKFSRLVTSGHDPARFPSFRKITRTEPSVSGDATWRISHWEDESGQPARGFHGDLESREERSADDKRLLTVIETGFDESRHGFVKMTIRYTDSGAISEVAYQNSRGEPVMRVRPHIRRILPGSPAAGLNLKAGDAILAYNDRTTGNMFDYVQNTKLSGGTIQILRDGKTIVLKNIPAGELGIYLEDRAVPPDKSPRLPKLSTSPPNP